MLNHYHLVLRPLVDGEMSRFMGWVGGTHTMRYHSLPIPVAWAMLTSNVTRAFQFKTTNTSWWSVGMSSGMHCERA
jgi:hypothetical protein